MSITILFNILAVAIFTPLADNLCLLRLIRIIQVLSLSTEMDYDDIYIYTYREEEGEKKRGWNKSVRRRGPMSMEEIAEEKRE